MTLFERTKKISGDRGMSLQKVAEDAGLSKNTIYKWKNNEQQPRRVTVKAVAEVLGVSVDYLLGNTDEMHPKQSNAVTEKIDLRKVDDSERDDLISAGGRPISDEDWEIIKAVLAKYPRKED
ncbi:helix-turn-helix domain-containing protein [Weissella uvarum]|uniref:helix-turn-helix domain-containing protein n=1 Tax=Weissella uvarum TaxID=1479233 RepID=UPI0019615424|nr:helix-turn-helix transcriptional regulator [Weissella uvarum]MCM0595198.1 helix-turn-helix transcriptional regulator [Weissella uvarum]